MYNKNKKGFSDSRKYLLGGGNSNIFRFHPEPWGKMNPFWLSQIFDQLGGNQPPPDGWTCAFWPEAACGNLKSFSQVPKKKNIYLNWQLLKKFVSGHHFFFCVLCVSLREDQACEETTVEYNGIRYVCYFTERTYGSISAVLKANRCTLVCKQWGRTGGYGG